MLTASICSGHQARERRTRRNIRLDGILPVSQCSPCLHTGYQASCSPDKVYRARTRGDGELTKGVVEKGAPAEAEPAVVRNPTRIADALSRLDLRSHRPRTCTEYEQDEGVGGKRRRGAKVSKLEVWVVKQDRVAEVDAR